MGLNEIRKLKAGNGKPKKKHWLKPFSEKRTEANKGYKELSRDFLAKNSICQIQSPECTGKAQGIHHRAGRLGKLLLLVKFWMAACNRCNNYCELHDGWAREKGFKVSRLSTIE